MNAPVLSNVILPRDNETTVDLAEKHHDLAIEAAGIDPSEIDLIVLATSTPDKIFPELSLYFAGTAGYSRLSRIRYSGGMYRVCLRIKRLPKSSSKPAAQKKHWLLVREVFSRILNWKDRKTCVLIR